MIVKINGKQIDENVNKVEVKDEVPDYVAWIVIGLGILAIKGWLSLWQ